MTDAEGVVRALATGREGRETRLLFDRIEPVATARQYLVRIGLVADVPDQAVIGCIVDIM